MKRQSSVSQSESICRSIRDYVIDAQRQVYTEVNTAMVTACWNIRQFYLMSPIRSTLRSELSWSHYRLNLTPSSYAFSRSNGKQFS